MGRKTSGITFSRKNPVFSAACFTELVFKQASGNFQTETGSQSTHSPIAIKTSIYRAYKQTPQVPVPKWVKQYIFCWLHWHLCLQNENGSTLLSKYIPLYGCDMHLNTRQAFLVGTGRWTVFGWLHTPHTACPLGMASPDTDRWTLGRALLQEVKILSGIHSVKHDLLQ